MKLQDMLTLYEYNYWANRQILVTSAQIMPEQFLASTNHSYSSLRGTLVHALDTEYGWRMLCQHHTLMPDMNEADYPTLDVLMQRWQNEEGEMRDYLTSLQNNDLSHLVQYTTDSGQKRERVLWHCLLHVVNHGTQHRSEAAAILSNFGHSPGDLDFTLYLSEQG